MDLSVWVGKYVKINLINSYYYKGKVISADEDFLELIDFNGKKVYINKNNIALIVEVEK